MRSSEEEMACCSLHVLLSLLIRKERQQKMPRAFTGKFLGREDTAIYDMQ